MGKKKHKLIENIIKDYNNKLNYDINHNDSLNIIHKKIVFTHIVNQGNLKNVNIVMMQALVKVLFL